MNSLIFRADMVFLRVETPTALLCGAFEHQRTVGDFGVLDNFMLFIA